MHTSSFPDPGSSSSATQTSSAEGDGISLWGALAPPPPPLHPLSSPPSQMESAALPSSSSMPSNDHLGPLSEASSSFSPASSSPVFRDRHHGRSRRCSLGQPATGTATAPAVPFQSHGMRQERSLDSASSSPAVTDLTSVAGGVAHRQSPSASPSGTLVWLVPTETRRSEAASPTEGSHHSDSAFPTLGDQSPLPLHSKGLGGSGGSAYPLSGLQQRNALGISSTSFCSTGSWADPPLAHFVRPVSTSFEVSPLASPRRRGGPSGAADVGSITPQHSLLLMEGDGRVSRRATDLIEILPPIHQEEQSADGSLLVHLPIESSFESVPRDSSTRARRLSSNLGRGEGHQPGSSSTPLPYPSQEGLNTAISPKLNQLQSSQMQFPKGNAAESGPGAGGSGGGGSRSPSSPTHSLAASLNHWRNLPDGGSLESNQSRDTDSILAVDEKVE